jgi:hypothetical protein
MEKEETYRVESDSGFVQDNTKGFLLMEPINPVLHSERIGAESLKENEKNNR